MTQSCAMNTVCISLLVYYIDTPDEPTIDGPYEVLANTSFNLSCSADANPPAIYRWYKGTKESFNAIQEGIVYLFICLSLLPVCFISNPIIFAHIQFRLSTSSPKYQAKRNHT